MNTQTQPTAAEIRGQIAELDTAVSDWEKEADEKSLAAVGGDETARKKLAEIHTSVERAKRDRAILTRARQSAERAEAEARAETDAEVRGQHLASARLNASRLMEVAERADRVIDEFATMLQAIEDAERAIRADLASAKSQPEDFVRGRGTLKQEAIAKLIKLTDGRARFVSNDTRGVMHWSHVAWGYLLDEKQEVA